jgi:hypothetical protein
MFLVGVSPIGVSPLFGFKDKLCLSVTEKGNRKKNIRKIETKSVNPIKMKT